MCNRGRRASLLPLFASDQAVDKHGITALLAAIWEGHKECVKLLIQYGASKDGKTPDGKPYSEVADKQEIIEMLS